MIRILIIFAIFSTIFGTPLTILKQFPDGRIVGGQPVDITQVPWQVSLQTTSGFHFCGGSIISSQWILTAAHCVLGQSAGTLRVGVGSSRNNNMQLIGASQTIIHSRYNSHTTTHDIALIKLSRSLTFSNSIQRVKLPAYGQSVADGTKVLVTGWGRTDHGTPTQLQGVVVNTVNQASCNNAYGGAIDGSMICAGVSQGGKDSCQGDSGGPLVSVNGATLLGVVSWGAGCGSRGYPGVYARVSALRNWIKQNSGV